MFKPEATLELAARFRVELYLRSDVAKTVMSHRVAPPHLENQKHMPLSSVNTSFLFRQWYLRLPFGALVFRAFA